MDGQTLAMIVALGGNGGGGGISVFAMPKLSVPYSPAVTVAANTVSEIGTLNGACVISLSEGTDGYDNEWDFVITQGATAQMLTLPAVEWSVGIAPTFAANSTTVCRLYYIGEVLHGIWEVA